MAESFVRLPPDSTGKKQRTEEVSILGDLVHQEVVTLGASDGTLIAEEAIGTEATLQVVRDLTEQVSDLVNTLRFLPMLQSVTSELRVLHPQAVPDLTSFGGRRGEYVVPSAMMTAAATSLRPSLITS